MKRPTKAQVEVAKRKTKRLQAKWEAAKKKADALKRDQERAEKKALEKVRARFRPKHRKAKAAMNKIDRELIPAANRWHRLDMARKGKPVAPFKIR
jgi:multidrug resistance efflux pump